MKESRYNLRIKAEKWYNNIILIKQMKETEGLVNQSLNKRKKYWKYVIGGAVLLSILAYYVYSQGREQAVTIEPETYTVETLDLRTLVDAEGKIINPDIANLSFLINGTLGELMVEEGQKIEAGAVLAKLDTTDLVFDLRDAQNGVNIAYANIEATKADLTDTDYLSTSQDFEKIDEDYQNTEQLASQKVDQTYEDLKVVIQGIFPETEQILQDVDNILGVERRNTGQVLVISVFNDSIRESRVKMLYQQARLKNDELFKKYQTLRLNNDYIAFTGSLKALLSDTKELTDEVAILLRSAQPSSFVSQSQIESARSKTTSGSNTMNSEINALTNAIQSIQSAELNQRTDLNSARNNVESALIKLENSQRNKSKLETNKTTALNIDYAQLAQARLKVDKAQYNLSLATLKSPITGVVVEVNGNEGETIKVETADSDNAFIKVLSDSSFTTEVYVEEGDIAKISLGQPVEITLEAIEDTVLTGEVNFISSTATQDSNGIVTYLVRINISDTKQAPIREGMTTEVNFVMGQALGVLAVPNEAIIEERFIILENGQRRRVETGFSDGTMTEIKTGLSEGDVILIGAEGDATASGSNRGNRNDDNIEERMKAIGERLEANGTKPANWDKMSTREQEAFLQELRDGNGGFNVGGNSSGRSSGGNR